MSIRIVGIAGSLTSPSCIQALVHLAATRTAERFGGVAVTYDLLDLQPSLGQAHVLGDLASSDREIVGRLLLADALIAGTPVCRGGYSGLFKHLFDLIDPGAMKGKPVLLTATGACDGQEQVIEQQLRRLFGFFDATTLDAGLFASDGDFSDGFAASADLVGRVDRALAQFGPWLGGSASADAA